MNVLIYKFNTNKTKQLDAINKLLSLFIQKPVCKSSFVLAEVSDILIVDFASICNSVVVGSFARPGALSRPIYNHLGCAHLDRGSTRLSSSKAHLRASACTRI